MLYVKMGCVWHTGYFLCDCSPMGSNWNLTFSDFSDLCSRSENGGETGMKVGEAIAAAMEMFFGIWDFLG